LLAADLTAFVRANAFVGAKLCGRTRWRALPGGATAQTPLPRTPPPFPCAAPPGAPVPASGYQVTDKTFTLLAPPAGHYELEVRR
jgi:hypothetical protein